MTDANSIFNTSGKIPTDSDFWAQDIEWMNEIGFTKYFSKVLGEQTFAPLKKPQLAFYNAFAGRPITAGKGWTERILKKSVAKHFKPNASAEDDLKFYESQGYEWYFGVNTGGWRPVSIPSDLESIEVMLKRDGIGKLNSMLVDNVVLDYQRDVESEIQMKLVTTCKNSVDVNPTDYVGLIHKINDIVTEMKGTTTHYNDVTTYRSTGETINDNIYTNSDEVYVFIYAGLLKKIQESLGGMPSPEKLAIDGTIIPLVDPLPSPLTTGEWTAGQSAQGWDENIEPSNLDGDAPLVLICSSKRCEYRPLLDGYKMNMSKNGAGDFTNVHMVWRAALAIRPWENCCLINGDDSITDETPALIVKDIDGGYRSQCHLSYEYDPSGSGTVTGPEWADVGSEVTLGVTPNPGYEFKEWETTPPVTISDDGKFTVPDSDTLNIRAIFQEIAYTITTVFDPPGKGAFEGLPNHPHVGDTITFTSTTDDPGYYVVSVTSDDVMLVKGTLSESFTMPAKNVVLTMTLTDVPTGALTLTGDVDPVEAAAEADLDVPSTVNPGHWFQATANAASGDLSFIKWLLNGEEVGTDPDATYIDIPYWATGEQTITAVYGTTYPLMIRTSIDGEDDWTEIDSFPVNYTGQIPAWVFVPEGYQFDHWENVVGLTLENPYDELVTATTDSVEPRDGAWKILLHVRAVI